MSEDQVRAIADRLNDAVRRHDLDAMVACFAEDYQSEQPLHPARGFGGAEQVRKNWATIFAEVPDLEWHVHRTAVSGSTAWIEVETTGTRRDGSPVHLAGVFICEVAGDRVRRARIYYEDVEVGGDDIDAAVQRTYRSDE